MKKITLIIAVFLSVVLQSSGQQNEIAEKYAETITGSDLRTHLSVLASDALGGRDTGQPGQKMAAAYIKEHFYQLGLKGPVNSEYGDGFYQKVPLYTTTIEEVYVSVKGRKHTHLEEYIFVQGNDSKSEITTDVVFAGSGAMEELEGLDFGGKAVLIINEDFNSVAQQVIEKGPSVIFIQAGENKDFFNKVKGHFQQSADNPRMRLDKEGKGEDISVFFVTPGFAETIFGLTQKKLMSHIGPGNKKGGLKKVKPAKVGIYVKKKVNTIATENVLGYLEGTDKKDELLVITSHYDHVGTSGDDIYNGADDDGSGTVAVLELAEAFKKAKDEGNGPRRSILFMPVTGEEKGLLGSDYYSRNPVFSLDNTVTNLNIDMIGRTDPQHEDSGDYVYIIGSDKLSTELHEINEQANSTYTKMELDYTYNDEAHPERFYYRSDHWNFAKNGVPIIFYFNGTHADYHKPTDTIEKIEFDKLTKRTKLVFYTAWEIANRDQRPVVDK